MDLDQRDVRRTAAREFLDALDQLQESLQSLDSQAIVPPSQLGANTPLRTVRPVSQPKPAAKAMPASSRDRKAEQRKPSTRFTLQDLEMAIADIDNYMQSHNVATTSSEEGLG